MFLLLLLLLLEKAVLLSDFVSGVTNTRLLVEGEDVSEIEDVPQRKGDFDDIRWIFSEIMLLLPPVGEVLVLTLLLLCL